MSGLSWIRGKILYWSSFLPNFILRRIEHGVRRIDRVLSFPAQEELYNKLADVALELHVLSRNLYLSAEKSAKRHRKTHIFWENHLKVPLNSALRSLKNFSGSLLSRTKDRSAVKGPEAERIVRLLASQGAHRSSRRIRNLSSGIKILGDFPAANGVVSSIWLGELENTSQVAVKLLIPHRIISMEVDFLREAQVWSRASFHENIVPLLGIAQIRESLALISPWMPERDLGTYLRAHPDANRLQLLADVACGLGYLHTQGIVYGNLRKSTVVVSSVGRAYLSSFLMAHTQGNDEFSPASVPDHWGIISFLIPEDRPLDSQRTRNGTPESDVFMYGTMSMAVFADRASNNKSASIRSFLKGKIPERPRALEHLGLTDDFWSLVTNCWHQEPYLRPSMPEVARKMVQLVESFTPKFPDAVQHVRPERALQDISAEIKKLGEYPIAGGGYCDLYLGERLGVEKVALKLVRLLGSTTQDKDAARRRFLMEAQLWAELEHPRILKFYGICEYGTMSLYMVSPWLENGNIHSYLSNVNPKADRYRLLWETAEGLKYLHCCKPPVVHGDLKAANVLVTEDGTAVLTDFGLSKFSHEATATALQGAGSPRWMAPELVLAADDIIGPLKTQKSDVYAYGHVMLEVLGGKKPFYNSKEDVQVIVQLINGGRSPRPDGVVADKWLNDFAWAISRRCTALIPEERPDVDVLYSELERLYISKVA